jgi:hypothetical protein
MYIRRWSLPGWSGVAVTSQPYPMRLGRNQPLLRVWYFDTRPSIHPRPTNNHEHKATYTFTTTANRDNYSILNLARSNAALLLARRLPLPRRHLLCTIAISSGIRRPLCRTSRHIPRRHCWNMVYQVALSPHGTGTPGVLPFSFSAVLNLNAGLL